MGSTHDRQATWKRQSASFSCSDTVWNQAKEAWRSNRAQYPAWTDWLEAALEAKADYRREELAGVVMPEAPDRLPTGRRAPRRSAESRSRRSFTCAPQIWQHARNAWWSQESDYPALSDWMEEALAEKVLADQDLAERG